MTTNIVKMRVQYTLGYNMQAQICIPERGKLQSASIICGYNSDNLGSHSLAYRKFHHV